MLRAIHLHCAQVFSLFFILLLLSSCGSYKAMYIEPTIGKPRALLFQLEKGEHPVAVPAKVDSAFFTTLENKIYKKISRKPKLGDIPDVILQYQFIQFDGGNQLARWWFGGLGDAGQASVVIMLTFFDAEYNKLGRVQVSGEISSGYYGGKFSDVFANMQNEIIDVCTNSFDVKLKTDLTGVKIRNTPHGQYIENSNIFDLTRACFVVNSKYVWKLDRFPAGERLLLDITKFKDLEDNFVNINDVRNPDIITLECDQGYWNEIVNFGFTLIPEQQFKPTGNELKEVEIISIQNAYYLANNEQFDLTDLKLFVNSKYSFVVDKLGSSEKLKLDFKQFQNMDGSFVNPKLTEKLEITTIMLNCKQGHWRMDLSN